MAHSFRASTIINATFICLVLCQYVFVDTHPGSHEGKEGGEAKGNATSPKVKEDLSIFSIKREVWIASVVSIFFISIVGLMGVAIVPLITKVFYNHFIQFLVALAVGTLTGDAMLHLLPHAIVASLEKSGAAGEESHEHEDKSTIFKGLVALGGVYFFFTAEKLLSLFSEYRAEKKAEEEERQRNLINPRRSSAVPRISISGPPRRSSFNVAARNSIAMPDAYGRKDSSFTRRMSRALSGSGDEILTTGLSSRAMKSIDNLMRYNEADQLEDDAFEEMDGTTNLLLVPGQRPQPPPPPFTEKDEFPSSGPQVKVIPADTDIDEGNEVSLVVPSLIPPPSQSQSRHRSSPDVSITGEEKHSHEGRKMSHPTEEAPKGGHGHGHSHEVPKSIAAVAWMVIMGDGLHNFSDGLAIGAAFAQGIAGGLSTAVAVFCHELPHELGDFAVLLKTGMKLKQALCFNCLSSVLCFVGMLIGIALGNIQTASYWIFAIAGGMFIYIALVDMLPELSMANVKPGESRIAHFFIQIAGIMTGVGIMLTIALFEDDIKSLLNEKTLAG